MFLLSKKNKYLCSPYNLAVLIAYQPTAKS